MGLGRGGAGAGFRGWGEELGGVAWGWDGKWDGGGGGLN